MSEMTRKGSEKWVKHITLFQDAIANQLCPSCESGLDETMHVSLTAWMRNCGPPKRGCPCCQAGLTWYPAEQVH
jgi:hypothetical protein